MRFTKLIYIVLHIIKYTFFKRYHLKIIAMIVKVAIDTFIIYDNLKI